MASPKEIAIAFLKQAGHGDVKTAFAHVTPGFRHHNPYFKGDAASLSAAMADNAAKNPGKVFDVKQVIAEGERVAVHSHVRMKPEDRGVAVVHIFRFEGEAIAELWDLGAPIPDASANENGMF